MVLLFLVIQHTRSTSPYRSVAERLIHCNPQISSHNNISFKSVNGETVSTTRYQNMIRLMLVGLCISKDTLVVKNNFFTMLTLVFLMYQDIYSKSKLTDVLTSNLVKFRSRDTGCYNYQFAVYFDRHLSSAAAVVPVTFQRNWKPEYCSFSKRSCGKTPVRLTNKGSWKILVYIFAIDWVR